ncbi:MAG: hypothetical protein H6R08_2018 [Proteobacteria bacterium]|jgi:hypothetical protein|nr:hypothetical protein [Pseudomonadota bacterium]
MAEAGIRKPVNGLITQGINMGLVDSKLPKQRQNPWSELLRQVFSLNCGCQQANFRKTLGNQAF